MNTKKGVLFRHIWQTSAATPHSASLDYHHVERKAALTNRISKIAGSFEEGLSSLYLSRAPTSAPSIGMDSSTDNASGTRPG